MSLAAMFAAAVLVANVAIAAAFCGLAGKPGSDRPIESRRTAVTPSAGEAHGASASRSWPERSEEATAHLQV